MRRASSIGLAVDACRAVWPGLSDQPDATRPSVGELGLNNKGVIAAQPGQPKAAIIGGGVLQVCSIQDGLPDVHRMHVSDSAHAGLAAKADLSA
jgi:hypothetical protein